MAADATTTDSKKPAPNASSTDSSPAKPKDTTTGATTDQVKSDVAANKLADPTKLHADASPSTTTVDWSKTTTAKDTATPAAVSFDNIYASTTSSTALLTPTKLDVAASTLDLTVPAVSPSSLDLLTPKSPTSPTSPTSALDLTVPTLGAPTTTLDASACTLADYNSAFGGACTVGDISSLNSTNLLASLKGAGNDFSAISGLDNKTYSAYASSMWTDKFETSLSADATKTLNTVFDEAGDAAKLSQYKPTALDTSTKTMLDAHKNGDSWSVEGTNYYKTDAGGLISRNKDGVHYVGADGLRFDGNKNEGTITKNGETIVKKGNDYFKKYPDGQQVQITEKGDIAAIEKLEGMVFEQRRAALEKLSPDALAKIAQKGESKTVQGTDGVQVFNVDCHGDVIAKSSNQHGAFVRLKDSGQTFRIHDGNVYTIGPDGKSETKVAADKLPKQFTVNPDGSIRVGTVTLTKDNQWIESTHHQHMQNMVAKVTADTQHGPVVAEVKNGVESLQAPDHKFVFDSKAEGGVGKFNVFNSDGSTDLTYNYRTHDLSTDGIDWSPQGLRIGDDFIGADNSLIENNRQIWIGNAESSSNDFAADAKRSSEQVAEEELDADSVLADAEGEIGMGTVDFGDVAEINAEYQSLVGLQGLNLDANTRAALSNQIGRLAGEIPAVQAQAEASAIAANLVGTADPTLTKEIVANGGTVSDVVKKRWSVLPELELTGDAA